MLVVAVDWEFVSYYYNVQSSVLGHSFGSGFVSGSQLEVLQVTATGLPDAPALTPHFVAHPRGSPCIQLPDT